jgi:hypothetical protein
MKTAFHFLWASLASTLSAMILLGVTLPIAIYLATGTITGEGFGPTLIAEIAILPLVVIIGGTVALPMSMMMGAAMLWAEKRSGKLFTLGSWIIAGLAAGLLAATIVGVNDDGLFRILSIPCLAASGALGAWVFARVWRRGTNRRV